MKNRIKKMRMDPPSGWTFKAPDGFWVKGKNFDDLERAVRLHYSVNNMKIPDDLGDVIQLQICENNPEGICHSENKHGYFPSAQAIIAGTKALIEVWLRGDKSFVDQEVSEYRAANCVSCPGNHNIKTDGCFFCKNLYKFVKKHIDRKTKVDNILFTCGVCECFNAAQVHLKKEVLRKTLSRKRPISIYPDGCWKKELLKEYTNGSRRKDPF